MTTMAVPFSPGDTVVTKLHRNEGRKRACTVHSVKQEIGRVVVIGENGRRMTLYPHQLLLIRKANPKT